MKFLIERMDLTQEVVDELRSDMPRFYDEAHGRDAGHVLAAVVARDGGVQIGTAATYADGQAVMLARKEDLIYALRASPRRGVR